MKVYLIKSFDDDHFVFGEFYFARKLLYTGYAGKGFCGSFYEILYKTEENHLSCVVRGKTLPDYEFKKHFSTVEEFRENRLNKIL